MQTVVELAIFSRQAARLYSEEEKLEIISFLASNPLLGDEIPGTGGVRKLRVPAKGRGKRGGARLIYFVMDEKSPIYALLIYGKNERADLSTDQRKQVAALARLLKDEYRQRSRR